MFRYGGVPSRLELDDKDIPLLRQLTRDRLRYELARSASWIKEKNNIYQPTTPPMELVRDMLAKPNPPLPTLNRITQVPVYAADGTLTTETGYHPAAQIYYSPPKDISLPQVPQNPTSRDIQRAKELIFGHVLVDFQFVTEADRAHAVALFLLPYARDLIQGPTPNHLVESPTPGSGKGLLIDVALRPAFGPYLGFIPQANDEDEWRKRITAALKEGRGAIVIDNLRKPLDSGVLAAALTLPYWSDRILGRSEMVNLPVRCVWAASGNNPMVSTEIARRSIRIRLDAGIERPWQRTNFKHPRLREWVDEHRPDLVWAALTLAQTWVAAGMPLWQARTLGSYERWAAVMGGILETSGIRSFLGNLDEFYETADVTGSQWVLFTEKWGKKFGQKEMGVADLLPLAMDAGLELKGDSARAQKVSLGIQINQHRDQVIGGYRIIFARKAQRASLWKLVPIQASQLDLGESSEPR